MTGDAWADEADYLDSAGADRRERDQLDRERDEDARCRCGAAHTEAEHAYDPDDDERDDLARLDLARQRSIEQARQRTAHLWAGDPIVAEHEPAFDVAVEDHGRRLLVTLDGQTVTMTRKHAEFFARCIFDEFEGFDHDEAQR